MDHRIIHFEIPADDPAKLVEFYSALLGWKAEKYPMPGWDYWGCKTGEGMGINGAIMKRMSPEQCITNYVNVEQLDAMVEKAKGLGAKVIVPRTPVANMGYFAIVLDPQNNPLGFWQNDAGAK
jgi:predicted enzyme related to lactoylglutathione lyase